MRHRCSEFVLSTTFEIAIDLKFLAGSLDVELQDPAAYLGLSVYRLLGEEGLGHK